MFKFRWWVFFGLQLATIRIIRSIGQNLDIDYEPYSRYPLLWMGETSHFWGLKCMAWGCLIGQERRLMASTVYVACDLFFKCIQVMSNCMFSELIWQSHYLQLQSYGYASNWLDPQNEAAKTKHDQFSGHLGTLILTHEDNICMYIYTCFKEM